VVLQEGNSAKELQEGSFVKALQGHVKKNTPWNLSKEGRAADRRKQPSLLLRRKELHKVKSYSHVGRTMEILMGILQKAADDHPGQVAQALADVCTMIITATREEKDELDVWFKE
jgi:hypothetical protein